MSTESITNTDPQPAVATDPSTVPPTCAMNVTVQSNINDGPAEAAGDRHRYDAAALHELTSRIVQGYGLDAHDGDVVADVLSFADTHGIDSHGLQRFQLYDAQMGDKIDPDAHSEVVVDTPVSTIIDGHRRMGQLNGRQAMDMTIAKARKTGMAIAAVRHSCHYGAAGYYANLAAEQGLIGFSVTNTEPAVYPLYSNDVWLGTNPIACAIPSEPHPFFFDASTSVVAYGKVELYSKQRKNTPAAWVVDPDNQPIYDSADALGRLMRYNNEAGLLATGGNSEYTGGHKGYGFSVLVEFFSGIVSQGATTDRTAIGTPVEGISHGFMAIDPHIFGDADTILRNFAEYLDEIRHLHAVPGKHIYVHGDKEAEAYADRMAHGVPLYRKTVMELRGICDRLGISYAGVLDR
ncbi:Ldh family oxidoreductase [Bifidobacterium tissieri]|uniref:Ldh family oxidoreductase n=1 Tax=Bifidobacterium tissieri TaxID=1630162 RepID=A0A5M9ZS36_9BIFI|nr:Ldh family oxidoreductase [Bifidobacterium tissieri]KAA8830123.1 Ldh family oxidoreductase [Bifidobacterium tissieri]KAA8830933.1 Ldh family oxidoreductase [Bifidobacterium tissieri]